MKNNSPKIGILLMTYGSATTAEGVATYMQHIYNGKASQVLIKDFEERYRLIKRSPLIDITKKQASHLQDFLNRDKQEKYIVQAGMLHSAPFIEEAISKLKNAGAKQLKGIILSPQFSSSIMDGYSSVFMNKTKQYGFLEEMVSLAGPWPSEPHFIKLLVNHINESLQTLKKKYNGKITILFTTHSMPKRVIENDRHYLDELKETINAITKKIMRPELQWYSCFQSAGHTPEEWLKPDLTDILSELEKKRVPAVLIVPIQFLADHLEILYDLDIAAKKQCDEKNINYNRIELPNTDPLFIETLASIVKN